MSSAPLLPFEDPDPDTESSLPDAGDRVAAVDPRRNIVLEASAGTGKTRVLVDRYVNLLKAGVDPRNILAITFTRKAAAEMRARIVQTLRRAAETGEIDKVRWRDLSGRIGEIGISTIDAFCLSLLREFPLEADLDPGFQMADETEVLRYIDESLDTTLQIGRALATRDAAIQLVYAQLGDMRLRAGLGVLLERRLVARDVLRRFLTSGPSDLDPSAVCRATLSRIREIVVGVDGGLERFLTDGPRHHPRFALLAHELGTLARDHGGAGMAAHAAASPADAPAAADARERWALSRTRALLERLADHVLTKDREPRTRWNYKADHCDSAEAWRRHRERAASMAPAVAGELARFDRQLNVVLSRGVWRVFELALAQYRRTLAAHAVVDFPDALWRTLELLDQMDEFAQSRYMLEARYHHLLVDEFQDTSQAQWDLVWKLVQTWAAGLGIGQDLPVEPSIFIVGDRKQSIYGFRDAEVAVLARAARQVASLRPDGNVRRTIRKSFRATPALLAFTNDVFAEVEKVSGRADAFEYGPRDRFPIGAWAADGTPAVGVVVDADPAIVAARVATEIGRLLSSATVRDRQSGLPRPAKAGDVGILFRSREGHQAFESALEARGIPAYVYKGLGFFDADEVKDVVALLRYLADPASDLRAAAFARSRFVRLSDPALQMLAPRIAEALRDPMAAEHDLGNEDAAVLRHTRDALARWLPLVDRVPPADVLERALDDAAYAAELTGPRSAQARENLKKLRGVVRRIQNRGYATMARVAEHLDRLSTGDESNAAIDAIDAVNLMTVHAAKGLEFPIVFLVNLGKGSGGSRPPIRLFAGGDDEEPTVAVGDFASEADSDTTARETEESKRLLYVAITRARERLYLSAVVNAERFRGGRGSLAEVLPPSLLDVLGRAAASKVHELSWMASSTTHRLRVCREISPPTVRVTADAPVDVSFDLDPVIDPAPVRYTTAGAEENRMDRPVEPAGVDRAAARLAGTLVHRLIEQLGGSWTEPEEALAERARRLVRPGDRAPGDVRDMAIARAARTCAALLARENVRALLDSGPRMHEVPFSFREPAAMPAAVSHLTGDAGSVSRQVNQGDGTSIVRGTIDTIVCTGDRVLVLEFKTGARRPEHLDQVRLYVRAARGLFQEQAVHGLIVYPDEDVVVDAAAIDAGGADVL